MWERVPEQERSHDHLEGLCSPTIADVYKIMVYLSEFSLVPLLSRAPLSLSLSGQLVSARSW